MAHGARAKSYGVQQPISETNRHGTYYSLLLQYYSLCGNPVVATAIVTTMLVGFMYVHCRWV